MVAQHNEHLLALVTGATGYIGGRLVPRLLEAGYRLRCLVRDPFHSLIFSGMINQIARRATALAFYSTGINLGILLGFLLGGWINEFFGWRTAFIVVGLPGILLALLVRFTISEPLKGLSQGIKSDSNPPKFMETVRLLWSKRSFRHLALATALQAMVGYSIISWLPSYMIRMHGMGTGEVGTWLALSAGLSCWCH